MSWLSKAAGAVGGVLKKAAPVLGGLVGGPIGGAVGAFIGGAGTPRSPGTAVATIPSMPPIFTGSRPGLDFGDVGDFIRRIAPGGATGRGRVAMDSGGHCPSGYHPAKDRRGCVRNRKMNFTNSRATGRAVRRIAGAEKQYKKIFRIMNPGKKGKPVIRRKR